MTDTFTPDALVLRTTDKDGLAWGNFRWPQVLGAVVTAPDWDATATCGGGLHGYLDGLGSRNCCSNDADALWWIVEVERAECVSIDDDKVKFPRCRVAYVGGFGRALAMLPIKMVEAIFAQTKDGKSTTGDGSAAATTGDRSAAATTGDRSAAATTGYGSAAATTGDGSAAATTGYGSAAATTGYGSAAHVSGPNSIAAALGWNSTARADHSNGAIMLAYFDDDGALKHTFSGMVSKGEIEAGVTYRLDSDGKPVEVAR